MSVIQEIFVTLKIIKPFIYSLSETKYSVNDHRLNCLDIVQQLITWRSVEVGSNKFISFDLVYKHKFSDKCSHIQSVKGPSTHSRAVNAADRLKVVCQNQFQFISYQRCQGWSVHVNDLFALKWRLGPTS